MFLNSEEIQIDTPKKSHWIKRMGVAGFLFFTLKGILWLLIPWLAHSAMF